MFGKDFTATAGGQSKKFSSKDAAVAWAQRQGGDYEVVRGAEVVAGAYSGRAAVVEEDRAWREQHGW